MSDLDIEFGDPPVKKGARPHKHADIAQALRERPGEWARILTGKSANMVQAIKSGKLSAYRPAGAYEATSRSSDDGYDIYARYIGDIS